MVESIQIRYTPEKNDYIQASRTLSLKTPFFLVLAVIILLSVLASLVILLIPSIGNAQWRNIAIVVLLVGVFYILYYLLFIPFQLSQAYKNNENLQVARVITLSDELIVMNVGDRSVELDWEHVQRVIQGKELYMIIYKDQNQVYPLVPKRAFNQDITEEAFVKFIENKSIPIV